MISLTQFRSSRQTVKRFTLTVLIASIYHAVACIIKRPLEFGNLSRLHTFLCALISGLVSFPIVFAVLLLPLRAGLRRWMPRASQATHAVIATLALLALVAVWLLPRFFSGEKLPAFCHGWFVHLLFWTVFAILAGTMFFWPATLPGAHSAAATAAKGVQRDDALA